MAASANMECPLCLGQGQLTRAEVLERLGMKDFARVAQLSAEEAFRLFLKKHEQEENTQWRRFETELTKRLSEVTDKHKKEILALHTEKAALQARLGEFQKNHESEVRNAKQSERLDAQNQLQNDLVALNTRIGELETAAKVFEQQKSVQLEKLRTDLQVKLTAKQLENTDLNRKTQDYLREITDLRSQNQILENRSGNCDIEVGLTRSVHNARSTVPEARSLSVCADYWRSRKTGRIEIRIQFRLTRPPVHVVDITPRVHCPRMDRPRP